MLTLIDEFTKEALAINPARRIRSNDVIDIFADVMIERGVSEYVRSDNDPEMVALIGSVQRPCTSHREALGRTATAKASMENCAMSYSTERSSTPSVNRKY
jgi:hypothetical protein